MASRTVNKVFLVGHLGKDAETKFLQSGVSVTSFSVATTRRWKDKQTDEWKQETDWHNVTLWRAENLAPYLTKGKQVHVEGRMQTRTYEKDGQKHYATEVVADEVILLGGGGAEQSGDGIVSKPRGAQQAQPKTWAADMQAGVADDDVPF